jgi:phenol 2-monooxygenase (NADPH)
MPISAANDGATMEIDVLVVGAGPAGLMAAFALARAGVNVRIVDKRCILPFLLSLLEK